MGQQTFQGAVKYAGRALPGESLDRAMEFCIKIGKHSSREDVVLCVQIAGLLAEVSTTRPSKRPSKKASALSAEDAEQFISMTTQAFIASILHDIQDWVCKARRAIAGSAHPPCHTLEEVVPRCLELDRAAPLPLLDDWVGWTPRKPHPRKRSTRKPKTPLVWITMSEEAEAREHQMALLDDLLTQVHQRSVFMTGSWLFYGQAPLVYLANETRELVPLTGLRQRDLVVYVLTGIEPSSFPEYIVSHTISRSAHRFGLKPRREVSMTLTEPVATDKGSRATFKQIRQAQGISNRAGISREDLALWQLISELKGPWHGTRSVAQWDGAHEEWKRRGYKAYSGGWALRKHYFDFLTRLSLLRTGSVQGA